MVQLFELSDLSARVSTWEGFAKCCLVARELRRRLDDLVELDDDAVRRIGLERLVCWLLG